MITVVTGPPCSGKSTYVRTHAQPGDVVIDFDILAQALGSPTPHNHTAPTRHVTIQARRAAIAAALTVHQQTRVWIVDCTISGDRMRAYRQAGAHIITLTVEAEDLHRRASRERPGLWHRLIDQWRPPEGAHTAAVDNSRDW